MGVRGGRPSYTITAPGTTQQRPDLFARSLRASKRALDPEGNLNLGVLVDPGDN
ncbi:MAG: hypothetical protein VCB99_07755 [Myxococcota bacterium]